MAERSENDSNAASNSASNSSSNSAPKDIAGDGTSPKPPQAGFIPASPPRFISLNDMMDASNLVTNMKLVHEIALDEDFHLEKPEPADGSIEKLVAETMKRAFWDALSAKLSQQPPDYSSVLVLIAEVKEKLIECLLPRHERIKNKIEEVLDMSLLTQKVENGAFDVAYYAQFVTTLMSQLCAPARDEEIAKLKDVQEVVPLFKEIFRLLDVMHVDMANFTIMQMRPHLKQQSVAYEKKQFEEFILKQEAAGIDGLEYTREWLERSFDTLDEQMEGQEVFFTSLNDVHTTPANVLNGAFIELLNWTNNMFPETCLMDQQRFMDIAHNLRKFTLISSTLLVAFTRMGDKLSGHTQLRDRLKAEILAILSDIPEAQYRLKMVNISEHIAQEVNKELLVLGYKQLDSDQVREYAEHISTVIERDQPVHALLWKRTMTFVWQLLSHSSSQPLQLPPGLGAVSADIASYCGKFLKLASHNKAVFGQWYANIVATLMNVTDLSPRLP